MAISAIRKYLDDLNLRNAGPLGEAIDIPKVPRKRESESMLRTEPEWNEKRKELTAERRRLFEQFEAAPNNAPLGQEIKKLDDQIAECTEQMKRKYGRI